MPFEEILAKPGGGVRSHNAGIERYWVSPSYINVEEGVTDGRGDSGKGAHPGLLSAHLPLING